MCTCDNKPEAEQSKKAKSMLATREDYICELFKIANYCSKMVYEKMALKTQYERMNKGEKFEDYFA